MDEATDDTLTRNSGRTAIRRTGPSAPAMSLFTAWVSVWAPYLNTPYPHVLHHGEGLATYDTQLITETTRTVNPNVTVHTFDPNSPNRQTREPLTRRREHHYQLIISTYVLNTLPPTARYNTIREIGDHLHPSGAAIITVRADSPTGAPYADGVRTSRDTFQKQYTPETLQQELATCLPNHQTTISHRAPGWITAITTPH